MKEYKEVEYIFSELESHVVSSKSLIERPYLTEDAFIEGKILETLDDGMEIELCLWTDRELHMSFWDVSIDKKTFDEKETDFLSYENGTPIEHGKIREMFNNLIKENDLRPVVFHSLRHSSTTYKLKISGGDIKAVQGDTGHAEAAMITERYAHILDDDRRVNAEKFEEMFYQEKKQTEKTDDEDIEKVIRKLKESPELLQILKSLTK